MNDKNFIEELKGILENQIERFNPQEPLFLLALDKENHITILKDMIEQAELKDKHKHLLQLEKSTIEERIDTVVL